MRLIRKLFGSVPTCQLTEACVHDEVTDNGECLAVKREDKTRGRKLQAERARGQAVQQSPPGLSFPEGKGRVGGGRAGTPASPSHDDHQDPQLWGVYAYAWLKLAHLKAWPCPGQ